MTKPFSREAIMVSNGLEAVEACQNPDLDINRYEYACNGRF
jgi:hypothetical protein